MNLRYINTWLYLTLLLLPLITFGDHIIGGELSYRLLDNVTYRYGIQLKLYRDCNETNFDNPANIDFFDGAGNHIKRIEIPLGATQSVDIFSEDPCLVVPGGICVETTIYQATVLLPPIPGGYQLSYQRYARNNGISNIVAPDNTGAAFYANIPDTAIAKENSSPIFDEYPRIAFCVGKEYIFNHTATDIDGDSLVYKFCKPFDTHTNHIKPAPGTSNPPFPEVDWRPGFSASNPLPGPESYDSAGLFTAIPSQLGLYVAALCVLEYRDGVLLSRHSQDVQFYVVDCDNPTAVTVDNIQTCGNLTVSFTNNSTNVSNYFWDFGVASLTNDTSNLESPSYTYPGPGTYTTTLIVNKNSACQDTAYTVVDINELPQADFTVDSACTNDTVTITDLSMPSGNPIINYTWNMGDGNIINTVGSFKYVYNTPGNYNIRLTITSSGGCASTVTRPTKIYPIPFFDLKGNISQCKKDTVIYRPSGGSQYTFTWTPPDNVYQISPDSILVVVDSQIVYSLLVTSQFGCTYVDQVEMDKIFTLKFEGDTVCLGESINFVDESIAGLNSSITGRVWDMGNGERIINQSNFNYTYSNYGTYKVLLTLTNNYGCTDTISRTVVVASQSCFRFR